MTTRLLGVDTISTQKTQEEEDSLLQSDQHPAGVATLPATQANACSLELDDTSPTATLPSQERNPRHHHVQLQSSQTQEEEQQQQQTPAELAAAGAPKNKSNTIEKDNGINSDSFHRRISEDYRQQHHHQQEHHHFPSIPEVESMGEGWIPASQHSGGWSYSEGDEVNVPETSLPNDAQYSQIAAAGVLLVNAFAFEEEEDGGDAAAVARQQIIDAFRKNHVQRPRRGVQDRYPIYKQQQQHSMMPSVAQPTPRAATEAGDDNNSKKYPATGAAGVGAVQQGARMVSMPTPQQNISSGSAAQRNLTPEEKEAIEGRKKAALARRAELEEQRKNKVARNLNFNGGIGGVDRGINQPLMNSPQQRQLQVAPQHNPTQISSFPTLSPLQAQRAEENRQRALSIRQNKLMEEAVALAHAVLTSRHRSSSVSGSSGGTGVFFGPGTANLTGWKARIEEDVWKILTAQRHRHTPASSAPPSHPSTPLSVAAGGGGGGASGGSGNSQLTPEQRQRVEQNKQRAVQRQRDKIEEGVAAFMSAAMQRAEREVAGQMTMAGAHQQVQQQQQQVQGPQQPGDQMFHRFL